MANLTQDNEIDTTSMAAQPSAVEMAEVISPNDSELNPLHQNMKPQKGSAFMNLPAEIRNKIYEYLFAGKTVHVDTSPAHPQSYEVETENGAIPLYWSLVVPKLRGRLCEETPSRHNRFLTLAGPARAQQHPSFVEGTAAFELPSTGRTLDHAICNGVSCTGNHNTPTVLSLQLLQACKKIHSEAALIPYTQTFFIFNDANRPEHHESMRRTFGPNNRAAILNAAFHNISKRLFSHIPDLFTGLQRVWLDLDDCTARKLNHQIHEFRNIAALEGTAIRFWVDVASLHKERTVLHMEKALLGDQRALSMLTWRGGVGEAWVLREVVKMCVSISWVAFGRVGRFAVGVG